MRMRARPYLVLLLGEFVGEGDEEFTEALALEGRQGQYTREVVIVGRVLLLREIADHVATSGVAFGHDVKEEWLHVIVQRLVIEKQFGEETKILAVYLVLLAIHFEHRQCTVAIYLVARRMT